LGDITASKGASQSNGKGQGNGKNQEKEVIERVFLVVIVKRAQRCNIIINHALS